jgi:lipopolysaccharide biosynthesis regulator YciM
MADPRGKLSGADFGSIDVDSLLSDLERKEDSPAEKSPLPVAPKAPEKEPPKAGPPLYKPPAQAARPAPPPDDYDDMEEERTVVGVISRDLIEEATRGAGGLGQLFGKPESSRRPVEPEGVDVSFEESGKHRVVDPLDDDVIMTSAPALEVADPSAHDRITPVPASPGAPSVPDTSLDLGALTDFPDPFAPAPKAAPPHAAPPQPAPKAPSRRQEQPTLPVATHIEQDEPTRIGQVLPGDLDVAAFRAELAGKSAGSTPLPGGSSVETPPLPTSSPATPAPATAAPKPAAHPAPAKPAAPAARPSAVRPPAARPSARVEPLPMTEARIGVADSAGLPSVEEGPLSIGANALPAVVPQGPLPDERDALAFLAEVDGLQEWSDRAAWMEEEARKLKDKTQQARALLVVSEMLAMTGEEERAQALAEEARDLAPSLAMTHRQARARLVRERGFEGLLEPLEVESRTAGTALGRAHAAILSAEILRHTLKDPEAAAKKLDQAARLLPSDPRPHLIRVASELSQSARPARYRWPEDPALVPLAKATRRLGALRGAIDKETPPSSAAEAMPRVRVAFAAGDVPGAAEALASLQGEEGVGRAALWLASILAAPRPATRERALSWAALIASQDEVIRRRLAFWSFESGNVEKATEALTDQEAFTLAERTAAQMLLGAEPASLESNLQLLASDESTLPLASAFASGLGLASPPEVGPPSVRASAALGRGLALGKEAAQAAILAAAEQGPDDLVAQTLLLDAQVAMKNGASVATALAAWPRNDGASADFDRDRALAAAVVYALSNASEQALQELENAKQTDPLHETTLRLAGALAPETIAANLDELAAEIEDPHRRSLLLLEAAVRKGPSSEAYVPLLRLAHETSPDLPLAAALGLEVARRASEREGILQWLRARLEVDNNPTDLLREALALQPTAPEQAGERIAEALQAHEGDVVLRELAEQLAPERVDPSWRAARAPKAAPPGSALLAFRAALSLEMAGDLQEAARLAQLAAETGGGPLSRLLQDRCDAAGPGAARLAEGLIATAKEPPSEAAEREAYERLADLEEHGRRDLGAALQWHQALLERFPGWLPSLRYLEHRYTSEGREEELEAVHVALATVLRGPEASAHAQLAARLRMRHSPWESTRDLVELALRQEHPTIWALRQAQAHARVHSDHATTLRLALVLAQRTNLPDERTTLLIRAAEAAQALGDAEAAAAHLRAALEVTPGHLVALTQLAELLEQTGEPAEAAEALAEAAAAHLQAAHQAPLWYRAALLWLDKTDQKDKGVAALEAAAACDLGLGDTFDRLRALLAERGEGAKLAALLRRRLETEESPERRIELEVALGRALTEMGDRQAAKQALAAALDSSPDYVEALRAFVDLCAAEGDWESAEQALLRLGRLLSEPTEQAGLYTQLGDIYRLYLPNPERAEMAYQEVLKRDPASTAARERLVKLYTAQNNVERALEIQNELLAAAAANPAEKRQRTIELAQIHEEALGDTKKAEQILDGLRKEFPHETQVLRALAEFHLRHNHSSAANVLLDRAAADARRALATGRFELHFFSNLATVFDLRGQGEAAAVANGTVAALDGRPCDVQGLGLRGANPDFDDLIAPEIFTSAFRSLILRSAALLDAASVADVKALRATPLPPTAQDVEKRIHDLARAFDIHDLQLYTAPTVPSACLPIALSPPTLVLGAALLSGQHEAIRTFLVLRALKCIQAGVAVFCRTAPIDLWPMTAAFLQLHSPSWNPQGVDANKFRDFKGRLQRVAPPAISPDLVALAGEVTSFLGNRASTLQTMANAWGSRAALLILGDTSVALDAIAWAAGQTGGAPATNPDRMKWIGRNAEARDLIVFSVSDAYVEARSR